MKRLRGALGCIIVRCWPTYHLRSFVEERAIPFLAFGGFVEKLPGLTPAPLGAAPPSAPRLRADRLRLPRGPVGGAVRPEPPTRNRGESPPVGAWPSPSQARAPLPVIRVASEGHMRSPI